MSKAWIGVDLDGTLAEWEGTCKTIGKPIPNMVTKIAGWLEQGLDVKIFTARATDPDMIQPIRDWLKEHGLPPFEITCCKDFSMVALYDDRAREVIHNTGKLMRDELARGK